MLVNADVPAAQGRGPVATICPHTTRSIFSITDKRRRKALTSSIVSGSFISAVMVG